MSIAFYRQKGKTWLAVYKDDIARYSRGALFGFAIGAPLGFWVGFLVNPGHVPFEDITLRTLPACVTTTPTVAQVSPEGFKKTPEGQQKEGSVVASANGTKYYFPWCGGVSRIREENKIWFQTERDAQNAGYTKATSCQ